MLFHKLIATGLGIGYIEKGAGTAAAFATCLLWYLFQSGSVDSSFLIPSLITMVIIVIGVWSSSKVELLWGKDHNRVVIDEIAGMCITLLFIPFSITYIIIGFLLFRFFDIVKPLYIRRLERLKGGWGVMADDVLAGIYSNIIIQIVVLTNLI
jgi:phosphatidylglycerophosphatase A